MMNTKYLEEIKAREQAATPGPWEYYDNGFDGLIVGPQREHIAGGEPAEGRLEDCPDVQFIVHARTDIPALLAKVERLKKENAVLKAELQDSHQDHVDDFMRLKTENATLKKALELSCRYHNFDDFGTVRAEMGFFIHQAQEQEANHE